MKLVICCIVIIVLLFLFSLADIAKKSDEEGERIFKNYLRDKKNQKGT